MVGQKRRERDRLRKAKYREQKKAEGLVEAIRRQTWGVTSPGGVILTDRWTPKRPSLQLRDPPRVQDHEWPVAPLGMCAQCERAHLEAFQDWYARWSEPWERVQAEHPSMKCLLAMDEATTFWAQKPQVLLPALLDYWYMSDPESGAAVAAAVGRAGGPSRIGCMSGEPSWR